MGESLLPLTINPDGPRQCRCVNRHVPTPLELHRHHVWPEGKNGPNIRGNLRWLCPTTHSNVHKLWREYEKVSGEPVWEIRLKYSRYVRSLVTDGWAQMIAAQGVSNG